LFKLFLHNALKELQVEPSTTLFVGDSIAHDYQGAINAKIDFCYYQRRSRSAKLDLQPKYTIENMSQLTNLLDRDL
jgi:putative hydrolase of the HAD superfamily